MTDAMPTPFHQRIPYLIPWTSPGKRDTWYAIVVPGNGNPGRMLREIFLYDADGTCIGNHMESDPLTLTEVTQIAKRSIRGRWTARQKSGPIIPWKAVRFPKKERA